MGSKSDELPKKKIRKIFEKIRVPFTLYFRYKIRCKVEEAGPGEEEQCRGRDGSSGMAGLLEDHRHYNQ